MKRLTLMLSFCVFSLRYATPSCAQVVLPEVNVVAVNYKYLSSVSNKEVSRPVRRLEQEAAVYDLKNSKFYEDDYETYFVSFFIPDGSILAAYDKNGKLLHTAEKFKNVALPEAVSQAVLKQYPQWKIAKDVYLVNYQNIKGTTKIYKLLLERGSKRMKVKINEEGDFL